jgi:hypothetical protein
LIAPPNSALVPRDLDPMTLHTKCPLTVGAQRDRETFEGTRGEEEIMKYVVVSRLAPGVDNARKALEVFQKAGLPPGTESVWASTDGKTFINMVESDAPDMTASSTYAPFFEETHVFQVVPVDDAWMQAIQAAQSNWD